MYKSVHPLIHTGYILTWGRAQYKIVYPKSLLSFLKKYQAITTQTSVYSDDGRVIFITEPGFLFFFYRGGCSACLYFVTLLWSESGVLYRCVGMIHLYSPMYGRYGLYVLDRELVPGYYQGYALRGWYYLTTLGLLDNMI